MNKFLTILLALTLPFGVFASQITVPSATAVGQALVSTTTGQYLASSTPNFASFTSSVMATLRSLLVNGSSTLQKFTGQEGTTTSFASTNLNISGISGSTQCLHVDTAGHVTGAGSDCGSGSGGTFAWPFTKLNTNEQATSTTLAFLNGFLSTASSTLTTLNFTNATGTNLALTSLSPNALVASNSIGGLVSTSTIGNNQLQQSTISGISLGSNLNALTAGNGSITFSGSYNGNLARTITLNVTNPNDWTGLQTFTNSTSTNFSSTIASTSQLTVSGQADGCAQFGNSGRLTSTGSACGSGGGTFAYPFTTIAGGQATSSALILTNAGLVSGSTTLTNLLVIASSTLQNFVGQNATTSGTFRGQASFNQFGAGVNPADTTFCASGKKCLLMMDSDNTLSGVNIESININKGASAYSFVAVGNDLTDATGLHFAGMGLNSSVYNDATFGTGLNVPTDLQVDNSDGPITINSASSTLANSYVNILTGGTATGNERLRITGAGNLGIGTTTPYAQVQIASTTIPNLAFTSTSAGVGNKHLMESWDGSRFVWATSSDTAIGNPLGTSTDAMALTPGVSAQLGVGTTSLTFARLGVSSNDMSYTYQLAVGSSTKTDLLVDIAGHVFAPNTTTSGANQTGYWCYDGSGQLIRDTTVCLVSALKFKKNITDLSPSLGLAAVLQMKPITYYLKNPFGKEDAGEQIGFVADWSEKIVPDLVTHDSNGDVHGFNYEQYTAVLTKAIQELNTKIVSAKRSAEENWQWIAIGLLALVVFKQGRDIKKLKS